MVRVSGPAYAGCGPFGAEPGLAARPEGLRGRCPVTEKPALGFAELLRELRVEARLTQEELAEAARLSPRTVSDLERGATGRRIRTPPGCWPTRPRSGELGDVSGGEREVDDVLAGEAAEHQGEVEGGAVRGQCGDEVDPALLLRG